MNLIKRSKIHNLGEARKKERKGSGLHSMG